jgi:hypothetical protein
MMMSLMWRFAEFMILLDFDQGPLGSQYYVTCKLMSLLHVGCRLIPPTLIPSCSPVGIREELNS